MILSPMRYSNLQQVAWTRPRHDAPEEVVGLLSAARKLCTCFAAARERFGRCRTSVGRYRPHLPDLAFDRSEEHTSELQSLMRISYAVFCLKKKKVKTTNYSKQHHKTID